MKINKTKKRAESAEREIRATFWGIAAAVLAYLSFVCAVKGTGFTLVWVGAAAVVLAAAVGVAADRLAD